MILNISGRTDIVAFYSHWLEKRLEEGYIDVRNPFNPKLVSRINIDDVDAILFCTKNPKPILKMLKKINKPIIFQITLTPYQKEIEPNVPSKHEIIDSIKEISKMIDKEYIYIRYDPIFLSHKYNLTYHKKAFQKMCELLDGCVNHIIISFLDEYKNVIKNKSIIQYRDFTKEDYKEIGLSFSSSAKKHHMTIQTCFEEETLVEYGFQKGECFSKELAYKLTGKTFKTWKARKEGKCNCAEMVDIGSYNSCSHFCKYCYANFDENLVFKNKSQHDPNSSMLIGHIMTDDKIVIRK